MTNTPDAIFHYRPAEIARLYQVIAQEARYGHYVRIPARICRCLDYFHVAANRAAVLARLHSYYLFIGVVDDLIDSSQLEAGRDILKHLANPTPSFDEATKKSRAKLVTEIFKCHISRDLYPLILTKLEELYQAVVRERQAPTMQAYIEQRQTIGHLTAELSYLLIRPLLKTEHAALCRFLTEIGAVGCLIDSAIDLRADARLGLLSFRPTLKNHLKLTARLLRAGLQVILRHPRLLGLFLEALRDDLLDQLRTRRASPASDQLDETKNSYAFGRAA